MLDNSEPEPYFVIAKYDQSRYAGGHPTEDDVIILMEVSDITLDKDREHKLPVYAKGGVKEYWIINLIDWQFEDPYPPHRGRNVR